MTSARALNALLSLLCAASLAACASITWSGALADADDRPLHVRAELALIAGGDPETAAALAERALAAGRAGAGGAEGGTERGAERGAEAEARAFFVLVVASDALGAFERPLPFLPRVLDNATDPQVAARVAAEATRAWARLDGQSAASPEVREALVRLAAKPGDGWEEARAAALRELIAGERLRAGPEAGRAAAAAAGFVLDWKLSAPWGDAPALDFGRALGPETRPLAARETTGAGWDLIDVATTRQLFSDGEVTFFDLPAVGGVGFAEAQLAAPSARKVVLRLECNRRVALYVDGTPVLVRERLADPWLGVVRLALPAGAHRITVKLASPDGRGFFRLQVTDLATAGWTAPASIAVLAAGAAELALTRPQVAPAVGDGRAAVRALLELEGRLSRPIWDPDGARVRAQMLEASFGPHTSLDLLAARLSLGDSVAPPAERRQLARARYEAVMARSPGHPAARRGLARIERDEERPERALALLLPSGEVGNDVRTQLDLLDLYRERGWEAEALLTAESLRPLAPSSPRLMQELVDLYKAFGRVGQATALANELEQHFKGAGLERIYALASDSGKPSPELELALWGWEPQRHAALRTAIAGMRRTSTELAGIDRYLRDFLAQRPQDGWALGERVRVALQLGTTEEASKRIREALATHPDFAPMEQLLHQLDGTPEAFDTLEDARAIIGRWLAFKASPEGAAWSAYPIVNVLERTRTLVRKDGSTLELAHRVRIVQTKQGVDDVGDVRPPDGARLLVARTLKADGRVLEPERTDGKAELSFPELEPGDAVETAWVSRSRVAPSEGGYLTGVSFASWGAPMFELDAQISAVPGLDLSVKRFAGAPEGVARIAADGTRTVAWRLGRLPPVAKEPLSVSPRSFFPFADIRVVRADATPAARDAEAWRRIARGYASRLRFLAEAGPRLTALALRLGRQRDPTRAAFDWVKTEVTDQEQLNTFETPAESVIANRKGNRALVLWALLRAMGQDSELLLCAPERDGPPEDRAAPTPNPNRFFYPVVTGPGDLRFDPSRPYTPSGDLPAELGGSACLSPQAAADTDPSAALFVELPPEAHLPTFEAVFALTLDTDGNARGTLTGLARGAAASPLRQAFLAQDDERKRIIFEQWLASLAVGARLVDYQVEDAASAERPMRWTLAIELPSYASRDGDTLVVQRPLKPLVHADFAGVADLAQLVSAPTRITPLRLLPFSELVTLRLTAPPGLRLVAPAPDIALRGVSQASVVAAGTLIVTRRVEMRPGRVAPSEYESFRADVGALIRAFETSLRYASND